MKHQAEVVFYGDEAKALIRLRDSANASILARRAKEQSMKKSKGKGGGKGDGGKKKC